jgi:hypothetical protein
MDYEEQYFGQRIRITTRRGTDGAWHATAELPQAGALGLVSSGHPSEDEARGAALAAAMAELDRRRAGTGKP